jgi:hypothetical protein
MLGRVVTFVAGGWLLMSAFAWPRADADCANTWMGGALAIAYGLVAIFWAPGRYLNTVHACLVCLMSLALDGGSSAGCANNVMLSAVIFGASLLPAPTEQPPAPPRARTPPAPGDLAALGGSGSRGPTAPSPPCRA